MLHMQQEWISHTNVLTKVQTLTPTKLLLSSIEIVKELQIGEHFIWIIHHQQSIKINELNTINLEKNLGS